MVIRPGVGLRATGPRPLLSPPLGFLFWAMSAEQVFEPTSLPTPKKYNSPLSGQYLFSPLPLAYLSRAMSAEQVFEPILSPTRKNIIPSARADASSLTSTWLTFLGRCRPGKFLNRLFHRPLKKYNSPLSGRYLFSRLPLAYLSRAMSAEQVFEPTLDRPHKK